VLEFPLCTLFLIIIKTIGMKRSKGRIVSQENSRTEGDGAGDVEAGSPIAIVCVLLHPLAES
jgi:hypothetical protein